MDHLITCKCGEVLVKSQNGTTKLRGKIVLFREDRGYVVCKGCGMECPVPISMSAELRQASKEPKLFVSRRSSIVDMGSRS